MRVSIIIATHNRAAYLRSAVESALRQRVAQGREILIVDDASTDETQAVIEEMRQRDSDVRSLQVKCGKPSGTRNAGIRAAQGEFIAFLDDDDQYARAGWIEEALARFDADSPDLALVYGQAQPVDDALQPVLPPFPSAPLAEGHPVGQFLSTALHLNAVLVRRAALDAVGLFDEALAGAEDKDLSARIARQYRVAALQGSPVAFVRFHSTGRAGSAPTLLQRWQDERAVLDRHYSHADQYQPGAAERFKTLFRLRGWYCSTLVAQAVTERAAGDLREGRRALRYAFSMSPVHALKNPRFWRLMSQSLRKEA